MSMFGFLGRWVAGSPSATIQRFLPNGFVFDASSVTSRTQTPTYGPTVTFDMNDGNIVTIIATNNVAFTIAAPLNPIAGQSLILAIRNVSGGALGAITFNAVFKLPAFTAPANNFQRSIPFYFDGTNWREVIRGTDEAV